MRNGCRVQTAVHPPPDLLRWRAGGRAGDNSGHTQRAKAQIQRDRLGLAAAHGDAQAQCLIGVMHHYTTAKVGR